MGARRDLTDPDRDEPTLIITNDVTTPGNNLFARYAERMMVENELDAYIGRFHLDALTSGVPLNVDLNATQLPDRESRLTHTAQGGCPGC